MTNKYEQLTIEKKKRIVAEIDPQIARLAKSLAAMRDLTMNSVIERLLREWITNTSEGGQAK